MNTENITEYTLRQECESLAKSIIDEYPGDKTDIADIESLRQYAEERAHEDANGHQWVIYTYKASQVARIAPNDAEQYLADIYGKPFDGCDTYGDVCTRLAYAALYTGIREELDEMLEAMEAGSDE
jgi:hypothetical protein